MATTTPTTAKDVLINKLDAILPQDANKSELYPLIFEYIDSVLDEKVAIILLELQATQDNKPPSRSTDSEPEEKKIIIAPTGSKRRRSKKKSNNSQKTTKPSEASLDVPSSSQPDPDFKPRPSTSKAPDVTTQSQPTKVSDSTSNLNFAQTSSLNKDVTDNESGNQSDNSKYMDTETIKVKRPPPIIIKKPANWLKLNRDFDKNEFDILSAKTIGDDIKIQPTTSTDYRQISKYLDDKNHPYFTYQLQEDKNLKIVLRGIPNGISDDEILYELRLRLPRTLRQKDDTGAQQTSVPPRRR